MAPERARRFLLDNDGSNLFNHLTDDVEQDIRDAVAECPENVTTYLLCPGAGTFYYPTRVGDVAPNAPGLLRAHASGVDPFGMLISGLREAGKETFVTIRMNDVHDPEDEWNLPAVRRRHPDCVVDPDAIRVGTGGWMAYCMDYGREEVRQYMLDVIREIVKRYDIDGVSLDWMRFPRHLSGSPDEVWAKRDAMTGFMAEARQIASASELSFGARIPTSVAGCRYVGIDVAEWAQRGLVDFLAPSPFLTTDFDQPLDGIRALMADSPVPLYAGFDFNHAGQSHCPESLRAVCTSLYDAGADGMYVFNFPCWMEYLGVRPYDWLHGLESVDTARGKPLLFSVPNQHHRIANVDLPGQLPVTLERGEQQILTLTIPTMALPAVRVALLIHATGDVAILVNGGAVKHVLNDRRELFLEHVPQRDSDSEAPNSTVYRVDPAALVAGQNEIAMHNAGSGSVEVSRVNVGVW